MPPKEKVNILMVADQPARLLSYEAMLRELDENLIQATSSKEALEHLLKNDVAVVLMDVSLPQHGGFELANTIRRQPGLQRTAILFISDIHPTNLDWLKDYEHGAVDYISVPVVPELLRAKVSVFAELHRKTMELETMRDSAFELERMVDERTAALQRLSVRLMTTQDEERRRIARDLHDGLGQELAVAKMVLDKTFQQNPPEAESEACREASEIIDRAIQQVRSLSHLLHPPLLDEVGLLSAIRWYLDGLTERSGIETYLDVQPSDFQRLTLDRETAVFRIIQEALTNVFRHSEARKVWVGLMQREDATVVTVRDDGKGIGKRIAEQRPDSVGIGIGGMKQRAKEFGGELRLTNMFPGTLVELVIPSSRLAEHEKGEQEECRAQSAADRAPGSEIALI
jgi:signal transduction histidine kinase